MSTIKIKRALLSVADKKDLDILALHLHRMGVEIISTGGTKKYLEKLNIPTISIEKITGNRELFSGRMKTLSFEISAALLYRRENEEDEREALHLHIKPIDLVVCNLYPFEKVEQIQDNLKELVEKIDIGGPTMIRSAAKNYSSVAVLTNSGQYRAFIKIFDKTGSIDLCMREKLSVRAFQYTAKYDAFIANGWEKIFLKREETLLLSLKEKHRLRYGENPHQTAYIVEDLSSKKGFPQIVLLQGKDLSYNNLLDADAAWRSCVDINDGQNISVSIVKHLNPCGASLASNALEALHLAWAGDPVSAFGSVICFSAEVGEKVAHYLSDKFVELVQAPQFSAKALDIFSCKKNLRLLKTAEFDSKRIDLQMRTILGGYLVQTEDTVYDSDFKTMTKMQFSDFQMTTVQFGIQVCKHLKSNAIALVQKTSRGYFLVGAGMGNPNRLISLMQAIEKAEENGIKDFSDIILISDAFFPFTDNIKLAASKGIIYIVQPGGSIRDDEVISACNHYRCAMMFTGIRHFKH